MTKYFFLLSLLLLIVLLACWVFIKPSIGRSVQLPLQLNEILEKFGLPNNSSNKTDMLLIEFMNDKYKMQQEMKFLVYKSVLGNYKVECLFAFLGNNIVGVELSLFPKNISIETVEINTNINKFVFELTSDLVDLAKMSIMNNSSVNNTKLYKIKAEKANYSHGGLQTEDKMNSFIRRGIFCFEGHRQVAEIVLLLY